MAAGSVAGSVPQQTGGVSGRAVKVAFSAPGADLIAQGGLYRATFHYNPSMSGSAVSLAKLIAEHKGMS